MSRRKRNKISLHFPFSFFCMRLAMTRTCFSKQSHLWWLAWVCGCQSPAGLEAVTEAVSCGQDLFPIYPTEKKHTRRIITKALAANFSFLEKRIVGVGIGIQRLRIFSTDFFFLRISQWQSGLNDRLILLLLNPGDNRRMPLTLSHTHTHLPPTPSYFCPSFLHAFQRNILLCQAYKYNYELLPFLQCHREATFLLKQKPKPPLLFLFPLQVY